MPFGFKEIPDSMLQADGEARVKWVTIEHDTMPLEVYVPLHQRLEAKPITEDHIVRPLPVAVYKRTHLRGKYDDYEYCGDTTR